MDMSAVELNVDRFLRDDYARKLACMQLRIRYLHTVCYSLDEVKAMSGRVYKLIF